MESKEKFSGTKGRGLKNQGIASAKPKRTVAGHEGWLRQNRSERWLGNVGLLRQNRSARWLRDEGWLRQNRSARWLGDEEAICGLWLAKNGEKGGGKGVLQKFWEKNCACFNKKAYLCTQF